MYTNVALLVEVGLELLIRNKKKQKKKKEEKRNPSQWSSVGEILVLFSSCLFQFFNSLLFKTRRNSPIYCKFLLLLLLLFFVFVVIFIAIVVVVAVAVSVSVLHDVACPDMLRLKGKLSTMVVLQFFVVGLLFFFIISLVFLAILF